MSWAGPPSPPYTGSVLSSRLAAGPGPGYWLGVGPGGGAVLEGIMLRPGGAAASGKYDNQSPV